MLLDILAVVRAGFGGRNRRSSRHHRRREGQCQKPDRRVSHAFLPFGQRHRHCQPMIHPAGAHIPVAAGFKFLFSFGNTNASGEKVQSWLSGSTT